MDSLVPYTHSQPLRVAALIDLPRNAQSGGHVKCWERLAHAASISDLPLDLTVYFSGAEKTEILGPRTRICYLPPMFSTSMLKFLPYVPDHTDLAPYHPRLARELRQYDAIHTTDCFFAFAQTAERVSRKYGIPLVTSFHTDTPSYTRIFTRQTLDKMFGSWPGLHKKLVEDWNIPEKKGREMDVKLRRHVAACRFALVTREEDHQLADSIIGNPRVHHLRLGVDKEMFGPHRRDRAAMEKKYNIPPGRITALFVGRVDIGKNIYTLIEAMANLIRQGLPLHLITAGVGPAMDDVRKTLGDHCSVVGFVAPDDLAELYASVDVLALSSEVEIRSMAGVEAMASGCPVLVSKKSGVAELFDNTEAMQTVESGVPDWTNALRSFAADPARQKYMREMAADYGRVHLATWQDVLTEDLFLVWQDAATATQVRVA